MIEDDLSVGSMSDLSCVEDEFDDTSNYSNNKKCRKTATFRSLGHPKQSFAMTSASTKQSRLLSVESMSQVSARQSPTMNATNHTAPRNKPIPLHSLKEILNKKQHQINSNSKRSSFVSQSTECEGTRIAFVFSEPSELLSQVVQKSSASCSTASASYGPATKKRKTCSATPVQSALHEVCCRRGSDITVAELEAILDQDPKAASRPILMTKVKKVYNFASGKVESKVVPETYQYPLNLAISNMASPDVLELLVEAAPQVLSLRDNKSCSLHILLRHKPTDAVSANMMSLKEPKMVSWSDAKWNSALHVAVSCGASVETVRSMTVLYPHALLQPNFHGHIPLELAQKSSSVCSEEVCDYLWNEVDQQF
jgi:hypothetical protein